MHWTALMAKRYFPAHAKVADDLACIDCGYSLRTLMANAKCPECGLDVGNSLFVLAKPQRVAQSLRSAGSTYLAFPLILIILIVGAAQWYGIVGFAVALLAACWRLLAVWQLRRYGAILRLPVIGPLTNAWFVAAAIDATITSAALITSILVAKNQALWNPTGTRLMDIAILTWLAITMGSPVVAASLGRAIARLVGYGWLSVELAALQIVAVIGAVCVLLLMISNAIAGGALSLILGGVMLLTMIATSIFTWIALTHLGNAADETSGTWEELIDSDRVVIISDPPQAVRREAAAVPLSPGKPRPSRPPSPNPKPRVADT